MLDLSTRAAILKLREQGHSIRGIARALKRSRGAVREVLRSATESVPSLVREEKATPYRDQILELYPRCKGNLVRVHEELVASGAQLSYQALTAFCRPANTSRSTPARVTERTMTEEIQQLLKNLRLRKMAEIVEGELAAARKTSPSYTNLLARLLRAEWLDQQEGRLQARIKQAHLPEQWTLESFPFRQQPGVSRRQIRELAELEFIPKAVKVVFIGPTGVGKTGLASGLLLKALQNGYRGLFIRAQDLFDEMYASIADRASRKLIRRWARLDILLINEVGYLNLRPEQTNLFSKLMEERYRRKATLITTNLKYEDWPRSLGNKELTEALLSRLRHQCQTLHIDGPSLREPQG